MASEGETVKLLGAWASPYVLRVRIALSLKGVGYELQEEDMTNKSELLLKSNPVYKKVPVLIHNGRPICESMIIVEYIDQAWGAAAGPSILPSDPYDRAIARFWAAYINDKWFPSVVGMMKANTEEARAEATEQVVTGLPLLEAAYQKCSKGKDFFGGDSVGYLDIALGSCMGWTKAAEKMTGMKLLDEAEVPNLVSWADRFCSVHAVEEVMPEFDKLAEYGKVLQARWRAAAAAN